MAEERRRSTRTNFGRRPERLGYPVSVPIHTFAEDTLSEEIEKLEEEIAELSAGILDISTKQQASSFLALTTDTNYTRSSAPVGVDLRMQKPKIVSSESHVGLPFGGVHSQNDAPLSSAWEYTHASTHKPERYMSLDPDLETVSGTTRFTRHVDSSLQPIEDTAEKEKKEDVKELRRLLEQQARDFSAREQALQQQLYATQAELDRRSMAVSRDMIDEFRLERKPFDKPEATVADAKVKVHQKAEPESNPANPENAVITQLADALSGAVGSKTNDDMRRFMARQTSSGRELPIFAGEPEEWPVFFEQFRSSTEDCGFSNAENMGRLRKCLKGKARETVAAMLAVPDNLTMVMACLERRFGRPDVIVQAPIKRARSLTSPKDGDMVGLIDLSNAVTNLVSTMQLLKSDGHLRNPELRQNLVAKLPTTLQLQWGEHAQQKRTSDITLADFSTWLTARADAASFVSDLSCSPPRINTKSSGGNSKPHFAATQTATAKKPIATTKKTTNYRCHHCNEVGHLVPSCPKFVSLPVEKRLEWVQKEERCQLCFNKRHTAKECYGRRQRCGTDGCNERHHPVLHSSPRIVQEAVQVTHTTAHSSTSTTRSPEVLLRVLPVTLRGPTGTIDTFALCDEASTVTMVDEDLANQLGARGPVEPLTLRWTDDTTLRENHSRHVTLDIRGGEPGEFFEMCGRTSARLNLPVQTMNISAMKRRWQHLEGIPLTSATQACKPRILIGQDNAHLTIAREVHEGPPNSPVATKTKLGWVIHGNNGAVQGRVDGDIVCFSQQQDEVLHNLVKQSFQIDALGVLKKPENLRSKEDARATEIIQNTTKKVNDRWETGLLWKKDKPELPPSRDAALKRLWSVEARMDRDDGFREQYCNKINDYLGKGYARVLTEAEALCEPKNTWYLPHFAVSNPNKPNKIRLVFDAAARSHGISLNDELLTGPDRLKSLPQVLFKFRQYRVGFGGDIKEMFHQVRIREEDLPAQRFLWRGTERSKPPKTLVMDRMIFGAVSSPFSAQEIKNKNAAQFAERYPEAADAIINRHYMDDYLDSCESVAESIQLIKEVITVHGAGGFEIRNFISSSREVLESLPEELRSMKNVCQACKNKRATPVPPEMAPLPTCRLTPHVRPFTNTGVDYFGPLTVTVGRHHEKRYGVLFTCLSTRAVHLEIATSLSTDAAIMAIRRLCARRGNPAHIYSDNGTNFKGADRELKRAMEDFDQDQLKAFASGRSFEWHFNPPLAPHMGGSWERLVKSVKVALQAILHQQAPKDEVLSTVFTEAEAVVNSRPLSHVSGDADDEPSLTPFNFLIGTTSAARPPGVFNEDDLRLRKQWRVAQRLADHFWKRWMKEYLPTLTRRTKWFKPSRPVQIDDVVIICDDNMPRGSWPRGRVVAVHPGQDGIVRVVDVKTSTGVFRRPVTKLCVIDV